MAKHNPTAGEMAELLSQLKSVRTVSDDELPKPAAKEAPKKVHTVRVGRETAGRRGKGVTTVFDLPLGDDAAKQLAAALKQKCGTGGTYKDGKIEIQGDHRDTIVAELEKMGFKVKRTGG
jgi:predicted translation initiation factor SUI1